MAKQIWSRWSLVLLGCLLWLCVGCNPQSMSMLLMPFTDNKVDPTEYKLFKADKDKEVTVVVLANFKESQFQEDIRKADVELAEQVSHYLRKRCEENKNKLKLIPQAQVRSFHLKQLAEDEHELDPVEMGKKFKADFVLHMEIDRLQIYEPKSYPKMFRATTQITINLYKTKAKDAEDAHPVVDKLYVVEFPKDAIQAEGISVAKFRREFLDKAGREISRMFISYSPDELREHRD
jgi:hypothetical protein